MIYLIDDKKHRQTKDFGFSNEKLKEFNDLLEPIYDLENLKNDIFDENNIVLFHESFIIPNNSNEHANIKTKLEEYAQNNKGFSLVLFSGGNITRSIDNNQALLPVDIVYQNLELFIKKVKEGTKDLNYLAFGENHKIESEIILKQENALKEIEKEPANIPNSENLFIKPDVNYIQDPILNTDEVIIYGENTDLEFTQLINENLNLKTYDNIFIPICFGETLSDYNGLRLATHIRCTDSKNQLSRIFLYGFLKIDYLYENDYFNIIKTKNVELVDFSKLAFERACKAENAFFTKKDLPKEIKKLNLNYPKNYIDNHSIKNEWAIYQWTKILDIELDEDLQKNYNKVNSDIYFKYLKTKELVSNSEKIVSKEKLKIDYKGNPKVLLVDDEAEKGWYEILAYLLGDTNGVSIDYIGEDFKKINRDEIINKTLKKIKDDDIDIVLLDFRLNNEDFNPGTIDEITSVQIIKKIKKLNPGIQVIVFSATNKIWNLIKLQEIELDGFILKTSLGFNEYLKTYNLISSFLNVFTKSFKRIFLKDLFSLLSNIKENLYNSDYIDETDYHFFIRTLINNINVIESATKNIKLRDKSTLDIVYLNCYNFLEQFKNEYYFKYENYQYLIGIDDVEMNRYKFDYRSNKIENEGIFIPNSKFDKPTWFHSLSSIAIDYFEICSKDDEFVIKLNKLKDFRHKFIHNNKSHFNKDEIKMIIKIMIIFSENIKE